jgi:hypothetical protein
VATARGGAKLDDVLAAGGILILRRRAAGYLAAGMN